jgi:hypothetical protein
MFEGKSVIMFTEIDTGMGTIRTTWSKVRKRVKKVNKEFFELLDEMSPEQMPMYLVYLPYGQLKGDTISSFFPDQNDDVIRLSPDLMPKEMRDELGYGFASSPAGIILEKNFEYFIDLPALSISLPRIIRKPGSIFPLTAMFNNKNKRNFAPNGVLSVSAGCRSTFMAAPISSKSNYERMQHELNLQSPMPEQLYSHFNIFKEISDREPPEKKWRSCILYFPEELVDKIKNDPSWSKIKIYLLQQCITQFEPDNYKCLLESTFSYLMIQKNLKPNPYIIDTAKHIISTATGASPGYSPARNEDSLPVKLIEKTFIEKYGMRKYFPTMLQVDHFIYENNADPVYYSLQYPSTHNFSPKSRTASSVLVEMRELSMLLNVFIEYLARPDSSCYGSILEKVANKVNVTCLHNQKDRNNIISESSSTLRFDHRFDGNAYYGKVDGQSFAADGKFFRGCVALSMKK